jgi:hypothetical protein
MREVEPLEFGAIHPRAQLVSVKEAPTTVWQDTMRDRVASGVLVNRPAAESAQKLSRAVDVEETADFRRLVYRTHLASFLRGGKRLKLRKATVGAVAFRLFASSYPNIHMGTDKNLPVAAERNVSKRSVQSKDASGGKLPTHG